MASIDPRTEVSKRIPAGDSSFNMADERGVDANCRRKLSAPASRKHDADSHRKMAGTGIIAVCHVLSGLGTGCGSAASERHQSPDKVRHYRNLGLYRTLLPQYLQSTKFTSICRTCKACPTARCSSLHRQAPERAASRARAQCFTALCHRHSTSRKRLHAGRTTRGVGTHRPSRWSFHATTKNLLCPICIARCSICGMHCRNNGILRVLFVDDCSCDNTYEVLQSLFGDDPDIRIVRHETNKGVSAAILTGINAAKTEIVASIDCDCSYDPLELQNMLPLMTKNVAMVTASPYHRDGKVSNVPRWRLVLSHTLSMMYRSLLKQQLSTWTSCFRIYRKHADHRSAA